MFGIVRHVVCPRCGQAKGGADPKTDAEMPDPCWGRLPGVLHGCCGHGKEDGYLVFTNGVRLTFKDVKIDKNYSEDSRVVEGYTYENTLHYDGPISIEEAAEYERKKKKSHKSYWVSKSF